MPTVRSVWTTCQTCEWESVMQAQFLKDLIMMMVVWFGVAFPCENELHFRKHLKREPITEIMYYNRINIIVWTECYVFWHVTACWLQLNQNVL